MSTYNKSVLINTIVNNLEKKGESKDYIIGYMSAMLNNIIELTPDQTVTYLENTAKRTQSL
jgi:hypothetical protein